MEREREGEGSGARYRVLMRFRNSEPRDAYSSAPSMRVPCEPRSSSITEQKNRRLSCARFNQYQYQYFQQNENEELGVRTGQERKSPASASTHSRSLARFKSVGLLEVAG